MRGKWLLFSGAAILLAIAAGAVSLWRRETALAKPQPKPTPAAIVNEISLQGRVRAQHVVPVGAPVDGLFEIVLVEAGQEVVEGQVLARIKNQGLETAQEQATLDAEQSQTRVSNMESTILAARLDAARAEAELARARSESSRLEKIYLRQEMLQREGATPRLVFEKAQKDYTTAQQELTTAQDMSRQTADRMNSLQKDLELAKKTLSDKNEALDHAKDRLRSAEIHAPVDGLLAGVKAQTGMEVDRNIPDLFQIATDLSALEVILEPAPAALARIKPGMAARVTMVEAGDQPLPGTVKDVKDTQVIVEFLNPNPAVRPGSSAQVKIQLGL